MIKLSSVKFYNGADSRESLPSRRHHQVNLIEGGAVPDSSQFTKQPAKVVIDLVVLSHVRAKKLFSGLSTVICCSVLALIVFFNPAAYGTSDVAHEWEKLPSIIKSIAQKNGISMILCVNGEKIGLHLIRFDKKQIYINDIGQILKKHNWPVKREFSALLNGVFQHGVEYNTHRELSGTDIVLKAQLYLSKNKLVLHLNNKVFSVPQKTKYLRPPSNSVSGVLQYTLLSERYMNSNNNLLQYNSIMRKGISGFYINGEIATGQPKYQGQYHINNIYYKVNTGNIAAKIGFLSSVQDIKLPQGILQPILPGKVITIYSTNDALRTKHNVYDPNLQISVPMSGLAKIYMHTTLISTQVLHPGINQINTLSFPSGVYGIKVDVYYGSTKAYTKHVMVYKNFNYNFLTKRSGFRYTAGLLKGSTDVNDEKYNIFYFSSINSIKLGNSILLTNNLFDLHDQSFDVLQLMWHPQKSLPEISYNKLLLGKHQFYRFSLEYGAKNFSLHADYSKTSIPHSRRIYNIINGPSFGLSYTFSEQIPVQLSYVHAEKYNLFDVTLPITYKSLFTSLRIDYSTYNHQSYWDLGIDLSYAFGESQTLSLDLNNTKDYVQNDLRYSHGRGPGGWNVDSIDLTNYLVQNQNNTPRSRINAQFSNPYFTASISKSYKYFSASIAGLLAFSHKHMQFSSKTYARGGVIFNMDTNNKNIETGLFHVDGYPAPAKPGLNFIPLTTYNEHSFGVYQDQSLGYKLEKDVQSNLSIYPGSIAYIRAKLTSIIHIIGRVVNCEGGGVGKENIASSIETTKSDKAGYFELKADIGSPWIRVKSSNMVFKVSPLLNNVNNIVVKTFRLCSGDGIAQGHTFLHKMG